MTRSNYIRKAKAKFLEGIGIPEESEFVVDEFQQRAIDSTVAGNDTLVVAPTGSGKTYIAVEAITAFLDMGLQAVYTTPLKALSNTKYNELRNKLEPKRKVGLLTGDRKIDTESDVVIATTEIYRNELYRGTERYALVVLDEVHFIADPQRGPVWEESIILTPKDASLLMLSASISNASEIAAWLEEVRGKPCTVIIETVRPVELRYGFLHPDHGVIPLCDDSGKIFKEVLHLYGRSSLDRSGRRLVWQGKGGRSQRKGGRRFHNKRGKK